MDAEQAFTYQSTVNDERTTDKPSPVKYFQTAGGVEGYDGFRVKLKLLGRIRLFLHFFQHLFLMNFDGCLSTNECHTLK